MIRTSTPLSISDNGQVGASVQQLTTDAAAIGKLFNQNGAPCQLAISDTAADITAGLNGLNGSHIASITISDNGAIGVSVAQLTSDAAAISKLANQSGTAYQLAVTDTAADITAALDSLNGSNIASITISDNNAVGASVAQLTSDATAISKLANANATPYQLAVTDTAADITAALDSLDGSNIGSITISDNGAIGVSVAQLTSDATAISKLADQSGSSYQLAVTDTAADITAALDSLDGSNIGSITISDNGAIGVSVAQLTSDATAISELANQNGTAYQLAVTDTAADITAALDFLDGSNIGSITISDNGAIGVSVAQLTSDATAISKLADQSGSSYQLAVTDTAADITAALDSLDGSNIASITISDNGAVGASVAQLTSDATAVGKLANASGTPYQLAISDTAANVQADLAILEADVAHIASVTLTSGTVVVSVSTFTADQGVLNKIGGGFYISDSAANISASLNALNDANINAISVSDNGAVVATVAQLSSDATAIGKLANASGTPYQLAISDTAANVQADLASSGGRSSRTSPRSRRPAERSSSPYRRSPPIRACSTRSAAGSTFRDSAANISASLNALNDANINAISISDNGAVVATVAQLSSDATAIGKLANASGTPYQLAIQDTAANVVGDLSTLNADSHVASITVTSGSATLSGGVGVNASTFSGTGSGTSLTIGEALAYAGAFNQGAGSTTAITAGHSLSLTGTASLTGTTSGAGTLAIGSGSTTISSGVKVTASDLSISGSGTNVTLGEALTYAGAFSEAAGDTLTLTGGALVLKGANDAFSANGGWLEGPRYRGNDGSLRAHDRGDGRVGKHEYRQPKRRKRHAGR